MNSTTGQEASPAGVVAAGHQSTDAEMQVILERFQAEMMTRVETIEEALVAAIEGRLEQKLRFAAERGAHRLVGFTGTFGRYEAADIASELEQFFAGDQAISGTAVTHAIELVDKLRSALETPVTLDERRLKGAPLLAILCREKEVRAALEIAAQEMGFSAVLAPSRKKLRQRLGSRRPTAIIIDAGQGASGVSEIARILTDIGSPGVVMVVADSAEFSDRISATRTGVTKFLARSMLPAEVVSATVDALEEFQSDRGRILLVGDASKTLEKIGATLSEDGFEFVEVNDEDSFWSALTNEGPDLVLFDLDSRAMATIGMARKIHTETIHRNLPIIFLCAHDALSELRAAFTAGADDFILKPVDDRELVTRVTNRLERARISQLDTGIDPLTGLQYRQMFKVGWDLLEQQALKSGQGLSFAVIDIDDLPELNARFGHDFGDTVFRLLGTVLQRNFFGDDLVARWAGAEIVVALFPSGADETGTRVAEAIRQISAETIYSSRGEGVSITCSAGVSELTADGNSLRDLYVRAGICVERARQLGGNRVVLSSDLAKLPETDTRKEIVVVDADDAVSELLLHGLNARGYRARRIADGQNAVADLTVPTDVHPALIILDLDLPGLDGFGVLEHLKRAAILGRTRVIVLSARNSESEVIRAFELGAFDHMTKPFSLPVLLQRVRLAVESS